MMMQGKEEEEEEEEEEGLSSALPDYPIVVFEFTKTAKN